MDERFKRAKAAFEKAHAEDPRQIDHEGHTVARATVYHQRLTHWLMVIEPNPSLPLRLAAQCQHIRRWKIARSEFAEGRRGYLSWRRALMNHHAQEAAKILEPLGYDPSTVERVQALLKKEGLGQDKEVQTFEDAICLVFLEMDLLELARKKDEGALSAILRKTAAKMSASGRTHALALGEKCPAPLPKLLLEAVDSVGPRSSKS